MKKFKKMLCLSLMISVLAHILIIPTAAAQSIIVTLNGQPLQFDVEPMLANNRTMVPMRAIFEAFGATVDWEQNTKAAVAVKGDKTVQVIIDSNVMYVNGEQRSLDVPAMIADSRTFVPLRAVSEAFDATVGWDANTSTVSIITEGAGYRMMYASGGRSHACPVSDVESWVTMGWSITPLEMPEDESMGVIARGLYVKNGAAYNRYYFVQENVDRYIAILNAVQKKVEGQCQVYNLFPPCQSSILLYQSELKKLGVHDARAAIRYFQTDFVGVRCPDTVSKLLAHKDEYLSFRTDHHWTQLSAYYVYELFCQTKGITPIPLSAREQMISEGFVGSFAEIIEGAGQAPAVDIVYAWKPIGTNKMTYLDEEGNSHESEIVRDITKVHSYSVFASNSKTLATIENPNITDGSSCLVLSDSYGNSFVPLLVDHYQTVYVMDYRSTPVDIIPFIQENGVDDFIVMMHILTVSGEGPNYLETLFSKSLS